MAERIYDQERSHFEAYGVVEVQTETLDALGLDTLGLDALFFGAMRTGDTFVALRDGTRVALFFLSPATDFETVCAALEGEE